MRWETPEFVEIKMDAEVCAYQGDDGGGERTPWVRAEESGEADASQSVR